MIAVQNLTRRAWNSAFDVQNAAHRVQHSDKAAIAAMASRFHFIACVFHDADGKALIEYLATRAVIKDGLRLSVASGVCGCAVGAHGLLGAAVRAVVDHEAGRWRRAFEIGGGQRQGGGGFFGFRRLGRGRVGRGWAAVAGR